MEIRRYTLYDGIMTPKNDTVYYTMELSLANTKLWIIRWNFDSQIQHYILYDGITTRKYDTMYYTIELRLANTILCIIR